MRFSPEVLPVVRIITLGLIVLFVKWTPLSLEVKHVKVGIFLQKVDLSRLDVFYRVGK